MINKDFWNVVASRWTIKDTSGRSTTIRNEIDKMSDSSGSDIPEELLDMSGLNSSNIEDLDDFFDDL